jgi:hypothetical protein
MNIFKALSEGNGRISETNITSFMNYLFDSSNELNDAFVVLFLKLVDAHLDSNRIIPFLNLKSNNIRAMILHFSNQYSVSAEPEYSIEYEDGRRQIPDIVLRIKGVNQEDKLYVVIENKIKKTAIKTDQLSKQYSFLRKSDDFTKNIPIYSILISPDEEVFRKMYEGGRKTNHNTVWLNWLSADNENTIVGIFQKLIMYENNAEIQPIDTNTQYILKSFVDYLSSEFAEKANGKKNYDIKGFRVIDEAGVTIVNTAYTIRRYSNQMIRLFDADDNLLNVEVKPVLRNVIKQYDLPINLEHTTGLAKNTQILGREVINLLRK